MSFRTSRAVESSSSSSSYSPQSCRQFSISEIEVATQNFDESLVIGRGGFGKVYRGSIACGGILLDAAIKRLESGSNQGAVEFWAEVEMLSNLRHCHLVSLIGYCNERREMILVYDYMSNGTLADRLHKRRASLTWVRRLKICIGAARGLDYLHTGTGIKHGVIHRDVKSTNILLDDNWAAKISDFGLSKIGPTNQPSTYVNTFVRGTFGYMDPDYFQTGRLTRKSDVYAFGVVMFEVLCGKQAVDSSIDEEQWGLATWAQDSIKEGRLNLIVDSNIKGRISPKCLKRFALLADRCLHSRPKQRPTMSEIVVGLESILAFQEKTDRTLLIKHFGTRVPTFFFPPNLKNSVGGTSLKSLDVYFYTVDENTIVRKFDFNAIVYATKNFSEANRLAQYSGQMYKGRLQNGQDLAIAQPYSDSRSKDVVNEASILVKVEHENVVSLLGYCIDGTKSYILYDFAPYATLAGLIFDPMCNLLDWNKRYKIILGIARALVYLHKHAPIRIIHRIVKSRNILLDESYNPRLAGFGSTLTINETDSVSVSNVPGLFYTYDRGYIAPECLMSLCWSTKADVYSFGILVLETVTGKSVLELSCLAAEKSLGFVQYVHKNWLEGTFSDVIDPRIDVDSFLMTKLAEIGLLCIQELAADRPTMEEVTGMLLGTTSLTLHVSKMRARLINGVPRDIPPDLGWCIEDYDTSAVEDFISELDPR